MRVFYAVLLIFFPLSLLLSACSNQIHAAEGNPSLEQLVELAGQGQARAQSSLGSMYLQGKGVPQDFVKASEWTEKAALQGHVEAQSVLEKISDKNRDQ